MARRSALATVAATAAVAVLMAMAPSAVAADDRAQLRALVGAARADLQSAAAQIPDLIDEDRRIVREQLERLRVDASAASDAVSGASDTSSVAKAAKLVRALSSRAKALKASVKADAVALAAIARTRAEARKLLDAWAAGSLSDTAYETRQDAWALAGAHATRDRDRARTAILRLTTPGAATSAQAIAQAAGGRLPATVAGMTPIPGGCALPVAAEGRFIGAATRPGLHLWTTDQQVAEHRMRLEQPTSALSLAHRRMIALSERLITEPIQPDVPGDVTTRSLRIGYAWLATQRAEFGESLRRDLLAVTADHEPHDKVVHEAKIAMAAATMADWLAVGADEPLAEQLRIAREVLLIRSVGEMSCTIAFGADIMVNTPNHAVVIAAGAATTALAIARDHPAVAAAVVSAAIDAGQDGFDALADGGSFEGPTYWGFQTVPLAGMLSSLDSVLAGSLPPGLPNFRAAGRFAYYATTQAGYITPFSDTDSDTLRCTLPAWLAGRWGDPAATAAAVRGELRQGVELLWWPEDEESAPALQSEVFATTGLAALHAGEATAWLKGQTPLSTHTQLDAGTVALTTGDVTWTFDPGYGPTGEDEGYSDNEPDGRRWTYPQTQPQWHSTLRAGSGLGQVVGATAAISGSGNTSIVDLAHALPGVESARRLVTLADRQLTIRDTVISAKAQPFAWGWLTDAEVTVSGQTVTLVKSGRTLTMTWLGLPKGSTIAVEQVPSGLRYLSGAKASLLAVRIPATVTLDMTATVAW